MIVSSPSHVDKRTVGCVLTHDNKYLLFLRVKEQVWNSVSGSLEPFDKDILDGVKRELREELSLDITPSFLQTSFHQYGDTVIEYNLFYYDLGKDEFSSIVLDPVHSEMRLCSLQDAFALPLFEDEDACLQAHYKLKNRHN